MICIDTSFFEKISQSECSGLSADRSHGACCLGSRPVFPAQHQGASVHRAQRGTSRGPCFELSLVNVSNGEGTPGLPREGPRVSWTAPHLRRSFPSKGGNACKRERLPGVVCVSSDSGSWVPCSRYAPWPGGQRSDQNHGSLLLPRLCSCGQQAC